MEWNEIGASARSCSIGAVWRYFAINLGGKKVSVFFWEFVFSPPIQFIIVCLCRVLGRKVCGAKRAVNWQCGGLRGGQADWRLLSTGCRLAKWARATHATSGSKYGTLNGGINLGINQVGLEEEEEEGAPKEKVPRGSRKLAFAVWHLLHCVSVPSGTVL